MASVTIWRITDPDAGTRSVVGSFDPSTADRYDDKDSDAGISLATGSRFIRETLYQTRTGTWVLYCDSLIEGIPSGYYMIAELFALIWLRRCGHKAEVVKCMADPGGYPPAWGLDYVRLGELLNKVDEVAVGQGVPRDYVIQRLIERGLACQELQPGAAATALGPLARRML